MRALKNWTVTTKSLRYAERGLLNYANYLIDQERHKEQSIQVVGNNLENIAKRANEYDLHKRLEVKANKGGRPANYGWSVMFSYPFKIGAADFEQLIKKVTTDFYRYVNEVNQLNLNDEEIEELSNDYVLSVIHRGENINNHVHIVFSKHLPKRKSGLFSTNKKTITTIDLTKKKYTYNLKAINDRAVKSVLGIEKESYTIKKNTQSKKRKSQATTKRIALDIEKGELTHARAELEKQMRAYDSKLLEIEKKYNHSVEINKKLKEEAVEMQEYKRERFLKDLELHRDYMSKGMTIKAEKLEAKIERKIQKNNPSPGM